MGANIKQLLDKAKDAIAAGESSLRKAAELIAQALETGATQRQIAKRVGKSQSWVHQLMAWRKAGYVGGAFERSNRARVISRTNQKRKPTTPEQVAKIEFQTERAKAIAAMFTETKRIPESGTCRIDCCAQGSPVAAGRDDPPPAQYVMG